MGLNFIKCNCNYGGDSLVLVERRVRGRKVANSLFDSRIGNVLLSRWKKHFTLIFVGVKQSTSVVAQPG